MNKTLAAEEIMTAFGQRTGLLDDAQPPQRYLWTDAFAVCNYLELYRLSGKKRYLSTALKLIDQVHVILGQYGVNDSRTGWISGLDEDSGKQHPTRGGLRIGKKMAERRPDEPIDHDLEWDRDGQYFHYLTRWMHALNVTTRLVADDCFNLWALELAQAAYAGFSFTPPTGGKKQLYWKMSIDLSYPLVRSMGQHDPLDGLITYTQLQATAEIDKDVRSGISLDREISELSTMCTGMNWVTSDALGIGGVLTDACRLAQLMVEAQVQEADRLAALLRDAEVGLHMFAHVGHLARSARQRLAFRELGLSIGVRAMETLSQVIRQHSAAFPDSRKLSAQLSTLAKYRGLASDIEAFWLDPGHQRSPTWIDHFDINTVMLATSLAPAGYLVLP